MKHFLNRMKKQYLWQLITALTIFFAVSCEEIDDNNINPDNDDVQLYCTGMNEINRIVGGWSQDITLNYTSNVECKVVIPEESQKWISVPVSAKAAQEPVSNSTTITIAENNSGEMRTAVVYIVVADAPSHKLEYTIKQNRRYTIQYTTSNGKALEIKPPKSMLGVKLGANTYENGVGTMDFDAPFTYVGYLDFAKLNNLESIIIPEGVVEIKSSAFKESKQLKSVTLPSTLVTIGEDAFKNCELLESINLPESITTIQSCAFGFCNLTEVILPSGITEVANSLFIKCPNLTKVSIPNTVTNIGMSAFQGCGKLVDVNIPDNVTIIGSNAFGDCTRIKSVTIPGSLVSNDGSVFAGCVSLQYVTICEGVTSLSNNMFLDCRSMKNIVIPSSVTSISGGAFWGCAGEVEMNSKIVETDLEQDKGGFIRGWLMCSNISKIVLGKTITKIGNYAFHGENSVECKSLKEVIINGDITSIGQGAFYNCIGITEITIPESVSSIGSYAFFNCGVKTVYCKAKTPPTGGDKMFYINAGLSKIYVPRASVQAYKNAEYWTKFASRIEGYDF